MLDTLREMLEQDPFVPFEIVMNSGDRFRIENPGLISWGEGQLTYYFPHSDGLVHLRQNQVAFVQVGEGRD